MTTKRILFPFGLSPRRVRRTQIERLREAVALARQSAFERYLEAFPTCLRHPGFGFKTWRFGDGYTLRRGTDGAVDRLLDRSPTAGKRVAA